MQEYELTFIDSISEIGAKDWNLLSGTENPFTRYEFLYALEATGCTIPETGWQPMHVWVRWREESRSGIGNTAAVMTLYLKTNSWGEYVFDWSWANAYESHGLSYYPKFVTAAPFTPSIGQRVFICPTANRCSVLKLIRDKIRDKAESHEASSWHILFPLEEEHKELVQLGMHARIGTQFHWYNKDYDSYSDFLEALNSRKRKTIRKERQEVKNQGITFRVTEGPEISLQQWSDFYLFYQSTYLMRGMQGYLDQEFFLSISESMPEQLFLVNAIQDDHEIAAALFFKNREKLFGRYWGCRAERQFLHFETCFYQGQEYIIRNKLKSFDSGAQGEHKIQRGFEPILTFSNHWIANRQFSDAIKQFLIEERLHINRYRAEAESLLPFKKVNR